MTCHKCYYSTIVHIYTWLQTSIFHMKPLKKLLDISNKTWLGYKLQEWCFGLVKIETLKMNDCTYQISNVSKLSHFHVTCVIDSYWKNWTIKKTMLRQVTGTGAVFEFIKVFLITFHTLYGCWEKLSSFYFNAIWEHYSVIAFFITDIDPYCKWRWECRILISNRHFYIFPYPFFSKIM